MIYLDSSGSESDEWDMGPMVNLPSKALPETMNIVCEINECDRLIESISKSDLLGVQDILENSDDSMIDIVLGSGGTALMYACATSQSHIVEYLIQKGSNVNRVHVRQTPLLYACSSCTGQKIATLECVKLLLAHDARVNVSDVDGLTPLMNAILNDHDDVILMLLPLCNIEMEDSRGWKAAFYAVQKNNPQILRKLLLSGASLKDMDSSGVKLETMGRFSDNEDIRNVINEFASEFDDDEDNYQIILTQKYKWQNGYPDISYDCKDPEYSYDVYKMLCGMSSEGLIPNFEEVNLSLQEFLSLDEKDLINMGIKYPFQRHKILQGIDLFFRRPWNAKSVIGFEKKSKESFDLIKCLTNLSFHRKQMIVLACTLNYYNKKAKEIEKNKEYDDCMILLNKNLRKLRNTVQNLKLKISYADQFTDRLPPDYISNKEKYPENFFKDVFLNFSLKLLSVSLPGLLHGFM